MINQTLAEVIKHIQKSISFDSFLILFDNQSFKTNNQKYFDFEIKNSININFEQYYKSYFLDKPEFIFKINEENNIKDCKLTIHLKQTSKYKRIQTYIDFYIINKITEKSSAIIHQNFDDKNKLYLTSRIDNNTFIQQTLVKTVDKVLVNSDTFTPIDKINNLIDNLIFI